MNLTQEQKLILHSTGNIRINAVAGSGKTTTVIEYAKTRAPDSRILYLAFNKSVKLEAAKKFAEKGLQNVTVETAHSLAYKNIVFRHKYTVRTLGYKTHELVDLLKLKGNDEKHTEFILANHINRFMAYYCNSDIQRVEDLNYLDVIVDPKAKAFARSFYRYIESQVMLLFDKMDRGEIEITHDFYLKKFQLSNPQLLFDYILFDEGQDASPAMLDIFLKQTATKVIVGDTHQQIYGWRFAVNSLEKSGFATFHLSTSFRFGQDIAQLAMDVLKWKAHFSPYTPISITGKGSSESETVKAVLGRTNLGLLLKAIEYVIEQNIVTRIYFEGNINSYTYADDGASLYDVLHLSNGKHFMIRDKLIRSMGSMKELDDYVDIVEKYGNRIPEILRTIKSRHVGDNEKDTAEMIFSTVHRSKGMEYDTVELVNDFITEKKLLKFKEEFRKGIPNISRVNEDVNLLYVALTRTRNSIQVPSDLLPSGFQSSGRIHVIQTEEEVPELHVIPETEVIHQPSDLSVIRQLPILQQSAEREKSWSVEEARKQHAAAYMPWSNELDEELISLHQDNMKVKDIALKFGRTGGAIRSRIKLLGLA
jgi:F-box protein, helicase, 18